jgi:hypothetical protein
MGARFSTLVQTGLEAQLALCTMGRRIPGPSPGVNWPGCNVDRPALSSTQVKERVELYVCPLLCAIIACYSMTFTFTLHVMYEILLVSWQLQTY